MCLKHMYQRLLSVNTSHLMLSLMLLYVTRLSERAFHLAKRDRNLTDMFPYIGVHWQTNGFATAAYHFTNSFHIHTGCPCSFASLNTNT